MAIGCILIGVLMGSIVSFTSLYLGFSVAIAFSLYVGIGVASVLIFMTVAALRIEDREINSAMEMDAEAVAFH